MTEIKFIVRHKLTFFMTVSEYNKVNPAKRENAFIHRKRIVT